MAQALINEGALGRNRRVKRLGRLCLWLNPLVAYFFLWAPILVLVLFSFNQSKSVASFTGFTLKWYSNILNNVVGAESAFSTELMLNAFRNSLFVGAIATAIATVLGTMIALSMARGSFPGKRLLDGLLFLPVVIPEITQAISLAIFFKVAFDWIHLLSGERVFPGFHTIIMAHVTFNISYVAIVVRARLADMDPTLEEAASDLGANPWQTFWRGTFPVCLAGVIARALLAFTLSLDDFVITFFTSGVGTTTLPVFVYGLLKLTVTPEVNAISTIMMLLSTFLIGISLALQGRGASRS
ncbi:MAG: ABC transporter permease [Chloroflexi bacterium]|nr:ABC transporter permease [Chloroflexota bacterium]